MCDIRFKKINTRKQSKNSGSHAFTLIEILLSMALFSLIIGGITLFSARVIQTHTRTRAMQIALENSRFAIDSLTKRIRTSNALKSNGDYTTLGSRLFFDDNASVDTYCYVFESDKLYVVKNLADANVCFAYSTLTSAQELLGGANIIVSGGFYANETSPPPPAVPVQRGMVTTVITITYDGGGALYDDVFDKDSMTFQSTVSLRDY
jgi:prepilin-type N-terminal cleavage/methylation domain-containing protein